MVRSSTVIDCIPSRKNFPMPSVIRLNRYVNAPYKGVNLTRQNIFKRDNFECQYCGTRRDLTIDHVVPRAKGGLDSWLNLVTACKRCNAKKEITIPKKQTCHYAKNLISLPTRFFLRII
jgi:5-methylcytosine-specific restriction endonuclease McrA